MSRTQFSDQWIFDWFCPSVGLSHMNYVEYLSAHLDNTSLAQPVAKQCFMLFCVCVKRAENTLQQNTIFGPNLFLSILLVVSA